MLQIPLIPAALTLSILNVGSSDPARPSLAHLGPALEHRATCVVDPTFGFVLPAEAGTGAVFDAGSPTPWSASFRAMPTVIIGKDGKLRVAGVVGTAYTNPGWEGFYGGRLGYRPINAPLGLGGIEFAAEAVGGIENRVPVSLYIGVDVGTLIGFQARGIPNLGDKQGFFEVGFGIYLSTIVSELSPPSSTPLPPFDEAPSFEAVLISDVSPDAAFAVQEEDGDGNLTINCQTLDALRGVVEAEARSPAGSIEVFKDRLSQAGFDALAQELDALIESAIGRFIALNDGASRPSNQEILGALPDALREAIRDSEESTLPATAREEEPA
ncbi:MAG: hypothetical protein ABFS14_04640 [Gemmatimonadota bacterium]